MEITLDVDTVRDAENLIYYVGMGVFAIRQTKLGVCRLEKYLSSGACNYKLMISIIIQKILYAVDILIKLIKAHLFYYKVPSYLQKKK